MTAGVVPSLGCGCDVSEQLRQRFACVSVAEVPHHAVLNPITCNTQQ